jgi:hypothetical protein
VAFYFKNWSAAAAAVCFMSLDTAVGKEAPAATRSSAAVMALEGTALHYFDTALWDFHALATSATI